MQGFPKLSALAEIVGGVAIIVSLLYVGYEIKRNNDLAVVESQRELIALSHELRSWFLDESMRKILSTENINELSEPDRMAFLSFVAAFFDNYEIVFLSHEKGFLSDEQLEVWTAGMCGSTPTWIAAFKEQINLDGYLKSLVGAVHECSSQ